MQIYTFTNINSDDELLFYLLDNITNKAYDSVNF